MSSLNFDSQDPSFEPKRLFTPAEVTKLIPQLQTIMHHIHSCKSRAATLTQHVPHSSDTERTVDIQLLQSQVEFLMSAVEDDIRQILTLGGVVKDLDEGLVDFPGEIDGQDIWLCWKYGEDQVCFWHLLDEGFANRHALPTNDSTTLH